MKAASNIRFVRLWLLSLAIALAVMSMTGCGSLNVTMEILDPAVLKRSSEESLIASGIPKLSAATNEDLAAAVQELKERHRRIYADLAKSQAAAAAKASGVTSLGLSIIGNSQMASFDRQKGPYYASLQSDLMRYRDDLQATLGNRYSITPAESGYQRVVDILRQWQQRVSQAGGLIQEDIGRLGKLPAVPGGSPLAGELAAADLKVAVQTAKVEAADATAELRQISIQNSPYAYYVASAPSEAWRHYNDVYSTGRFGATDVAIKLDSRTGNYLLKGLSFDPSDVAAVAAKVATQAFLLSAQMAGVPVKTSSTPTDSTGGKALAASSSAMADAQASLEAKRAQEQARKAALLVLANAIVNEEKEIGGDEERRRAAVIAIRSAFDARAAILRPASTTP